MELVTQKDYITSVVLFWPRKNKEGCLKAEDVAACQKCCSHVHDNGGNTSNLLSHLKMHQSTLHGLLSLSDKRFVHVHTVWLQIFTRQYFHEFPLCLVYHENIGLKKYFMGVLQLAMWIFQGMLKSSPPSPYRNFPVVS